MTKKLVGFVVWLLKAFFLVVLCVVMLALFMAFPAFPASLQGAVAFLMLGVYLWHGKRQRRAATLMASPRLADKAMRQETRRQRYSIFGWSLAFLFLGLLSTRKQKLRDSDELLAPAERVPVSDLH